MTRKDVLFIHSAGPQGYRQGSYYLLSYLEKVLGDGYHIVRPQMPDPNYPNYELWSKKLGESIRSLHQPAILVGHSLGGSVLLKYLAEQHVPAKVSGLFVVAAPYWGTANWEVDEFMLPENFASVLGGQSIFFYHSQDDEAVPLKHMLYYAHELPLAAVRELKHRGHLFSSGLPELIKDIEGL